MPQNLASFAALLEQFEAHNSGDVSRASATRAAAGASAPLAPAASQIAEQLLTAVFDRDIAAPGHLSSLLADNASSSSALEDVPDRLGYWSVAWMSLATAIVELTPYEITILNKVLVAQPLWGVGCDLTNSKGFARTAVFRMGTLADTLPNLTGPTRALFIDLAATHFVEDPSAKLQPCELGMPLESRNSEALVELAETLCILDPDEQNLLAPYVFGGIEHLGQAAAQLDLSGCAQFVTHLSEVRDARPESWEEHAREVLALEHLRLAEAASVGAALLRLSPAAYGQAFATAHCACLMQASKLAAYRLAASYTHAQTLRTYALLNVLES